jgi:hypothetical protein
MITITISFLINVCVENLETPISLDKQFQVLKNLNRWQWKPPNRLPHRIYHADYLKRDISNKIPPTIICNQITKPRKKKCIQLEQRIDYHRQNEKAAKFFLNSALSRVVSKFWLVMEENYRLAQQHISSKVYSPMCSHVTFQ